MSFLKILRQLHFTLQRENYPAISLRSFCNSCSMSSTCRQIQWNTLWCDRQLYGHTISTHDQIRYGKINSVTLSWRSWVNLGQDNRLLQQAWTGNPNFNWLLAIIKHGLFIFRVAIENLKFGFWLFKDSQSGS